MKRVLSWAFYALFSIVFTWVMICVIFLNPYHETAYLIPVSLAGLAALAVVYRVLKRYEEVLKNKYNYILPVFCAVMYIIQLIAGKALEFDPVFDMGAVYHGAAEWVKTGTFGEYYDYFEMFPNNIGSMFFLFIIFKLCSFIGIENFFMAGAAVNSIMSVCAMAVVSLTCRKMGCARHGLFALALFALSLPFYIIGAVFYTDSLSLLFPALVYYLYLLARSAADMRKQILFYLLMGLAAAVGMQMKFTVAVALVAAAIDLCFHFEPKRAAIAAAAAASMLILVSVSVNGVIYGSHLDRETVENESLIYNHHIMMGLNGDGSYSASDYDFSKSFDNAAERNEAISEKIKQRVSSLGLKGMYELFEGKAARDFGDGTYGFGDFLDDDPKNDTVLHEYVLYDGEKYSKYSHLCTGVHIAVMILMLFWSYSFVFVRKNKPYEYIAPCLAVFGVFAVLMIWETNRRYFFNFVPMIFICAVMGAEHFSAAMSGMKKRLAAVIGAGKPEEHVKKQK